MKEANGIRTRSLTCHNEHEIRLNPGTRHQRIIRHYGHNLIEVNILRQLKHLGVDRTQRSILHRNIHLDHILILSTSSKQFRRQLIQIHSCQTLFIDITKLIIDHSSRNLEIYRNDIRGQLCAHHPDHP